MQTNAYDKVDCLMELIQWVIRLEQSPTIELVSNGVVPNLLVRKLLRPTPLH